MPTAREHKKPEVSREMAEAERIAKHMYSSLLQVKAPKGHPTGYILGAGYVMKMLLEQAIKQGDDKDSLKAQAIAIIQNM